MRIGLRVFVVLGCLCSSAYGLTIHTFSETKGATCINMAAVVNKNVLKYPHPKDYTYKVVCDEKSWADVVHHYAPRLDPAQTYALTFYNEKTMVVRGTKLLDYYEGEPKPEHTIAHELAHIYLQDPQNEIRVDELAKKWMSDRGVYDPISAVCCP
jgi:hypothetical protein